MLKAILGMVVLVGSLIGGAIALGNHFEKQSCIAIHEHGGPESQWHGLIDGCYVKVNGQWIPRDSWRGEYD